MEALICKDISIEYWSKRKKKQLNHFDIKNNNNKKNQQKTNAQINMNSAAENGKYTKIQYNSEIFIIFSNQIKYN